MQSVLGNGSFPGASDTTLTRVCGGMEKATIERWMRRVWRQLRGQGHLGVEVQGSRVHVGVLDGSVLGGHERSVLVEVGEVTSYVKVKGIPHRGKELPTSLEVMEELSKEEGKGAFDLLLGDGLYACEGFFKGCEQAGIKGVVKTSEETLNIVKDANGLFDQKTLAEGIEYVEGIDVERMCQYRIWAVAGLQWSESCQYLKVARVEETPLKGKEAGKSSRFYVFSQAPRLSAMSLRQLAHLRWFIENNGFKALNEQVHSKHCFSHHSSTALVISLLQMIAAMLASAYHSFLKRNQHLMKSLWDHGTFSMQFLRTLLWSSLFLAKVDSS